MKREHLEKIILDASEEHYLDLAINLNLNDVAKKSMLVKQHYIRLLDQICSG